MKTTTLTLNGNRDLKFGNLSWALTSGNSEAGPSAYVIPLGWGFRVKND